MPETKVDSKGNVVDAKTGKIVEKAGERRVKPLQPITDEELDRRKKAREERERSTAPTTTTSPTPAPPAPSPAPAASPTSDEGLAALARRTRAQREVLGKKREKY